MLKDYLSLSRDELVDMTLFSAVFGLLFSVTALRFLDYDESFLLIFLVFALFIFILMSSRLVFMKYIAYRNGFEWNFYLTMFDKYGFRNYDRISYTSPTLKKGIPSIYLSVFLFILTLGFIIWPGVYRQKIKLIPHRFIGSKQRYESERYHHVTTYRESKVFFGGFIYYVIFALVMKILLNIVGGSVYNDFMYVTFYMAIVTMIPVFGSEGYDFWFKGRMPWFAAMTIMAIMMLAILIFKSITYTLVISFISILIVLFVLLWKKLM